jgi:type 1 glutamine amidotransferase
MEKQRALIVWGGWLGHQPEEVASIYRQILLNEGFEVEVANSLQAFEDLEKLQSLDLIVPNWTMESELHMEIVTNVSKAVQLGVGLAGTHGGMCDMLRYNVDWQFMTGGNWVAHPGNDGTEYVVNIKHSSSPLLEGMEDFTVISEQYYLHVDPAVEVLATTRFPNPKAPYGPHVTNRSVDMPVVWTKRWGEGKVFYCSLGHQANIIAMPQVSEILRRGFIWAANNQHRKAISNPNDVYTGMGDSRQ